MTTEPYLAIDWTGAAEADKAKALAAIEAAFAAIGSTAADAAQASFVREGGDLDAMADESRAAVVTEAQHAAADLWDDMETVALVALGQDPAVDRLPDFVGRIEPWASEALAAIAAAQKAA